MSQFEAIARRAAVVILIGAALSATHVTYAAAADGLGSTKTRALRDVATTSSIARPEALAENCYIEFQTVRGARGKSVVRQAEECD